MWSRAGENSNVEPHFYFPVILQQFDPPAHQCKVTSIWWSSSFFSLSSPSTILSGTNPVIRFLLCYTSNLTWNSVWSQSMSSHWFLCSAPLKQGLFRFRSSTVELHILPPGWEFLPANTDTTGFYVLSKTWALLFNFSIERLFFIVHCSSMTLL